jgi:hypothetical protein
LRSTVPAALFAACAPVADTADRTAACRAAHPAVATQARFRRLRLRDHRVLMSRDLLLALIRAQPDPQVPELRNSQ